jgi:hypothetical protein
MTSPTTAPAGTAEFTVRAVVIGVLLGVVFGFSGARRRRTSRSSRFASSEGFSVSPR